MVLGQMLLYYRWQFMLVCHRTSNLIDEDKVRTHDSNKSKIKPISILGLYYLHSLHIREVY